MAAGASRRVDTLSPREVALLAEVPKTAVEKAIAEKVLRVQVYKPSGKRRTSARRLPAESVVYAAVVKRLSGIPLTRAVKKSFARTLLAQSLDSLRAARVEIAPALEVDVGRLAGETVDRTRDYLRARAEFIVSDEAVKGGTPCIKGTRMTVYSVEGRVRYGDTVEQIAAENPDIPVAALEAAIIYARTHPLVGRPGGKPRRPAA